MAEKTGPRDRPVIKKLNETLEKLVCPKTGNKAYFNHERQIHIWIKVPVRFIRYFAGDFSKEDGYMTLSHTVDASHFDIGVDRVLVEAFRRKVEALIKHLSGKE